MKTFTYWAKSIALDAFIFSLFFLWKGRDIDGAGNVLMALIWTCIVIGLATGLCLDKTHFKTQRPAGFIHYHRLTDFVCFCALAFYGMFWTAGLFLAAHWSLEGARNREPKSTTKAGESM